MEASDRVVDVYEMKDRMMIDLFKTKLQESQTGLSERRGTWSEAKEILKAHFGKVTRTMVTNENKLRNLYQTALRELKDGAGPGT
jgi:uncharacterized protein YcgL (UPF0745 family)